MTSQQKRNNVKELDTYAESFTPIERQSRKAQEMSRCRTRSESEKIYFMQARDPP